MRIIEPHQLTKLGSKSAKTHFRLALVIAVLIFSIVILLGSFAYFRTIPEPAFKAAAINVKAQTVALKWPGYGEAAIGADGYGVLAHAGLDNAVPIASVAKIMTALAILKKAPLDTAKDGPDITLTDADVQIYDNYLANDGSVVSVQSGEIISEKQALEAMLLPSANNMADSLAIWAFGSVNNYTSYANDLASSLGLSKTHLADASGFSPFTVSSATDLVKIALEAIKNPTLLQIMGERTAEIPVDGIITNTNYKLGQNGIIGIKTGNTDQAGGCYLVASKHLYAGHEVTIIGAITGAPDLQTAINDGTNLLSSAMSGFGTIRVVSTGQQIGSYTLYDSNHLIAVAKSDINIFGWLGSNYSASVSLNKVSYPVSKGQILGDVELAGKSTAAIASRSATKPNLWWRARRALWSKPK